MNYHFKDFDLKEGDFIKGTGLLRSFSKTSEATNRLLNCSWGFGAVVIYRTNGKSPYFHADNVALTNYSWQKEVYVSLDTMKIDKITTISKS